MTNHADNATIEIVADDRCTGCGACFNACPKDAIKMQYNNEGFIYPIVDYTLCIKCGKCKKACPELNLSSLSFCDNNKCLAVMAKDDDVRMKSSSGGIFTLLAESILDENGIVVGAAYADNYTRVIHKTAETKNGLQPLRGSKYLQSEIGSTYKTVEDALKSGRKALFTGCPCQVQGLYQFLRIKYENLYTADLICHGVNSLYAYQSFIQEIAKGRSIKEVNFRDKSIYGWSTPTVIRFDNGEIYHAAWNESKWNDGFLKGIINRKCCASCHYAQEKRISDVTMGDFWQIHRFNPEYNDWKGTSLVLLNTVKGTELFNKCRSSMKLCRDVPLEFAKKYNGQLRSPMAQHPGRKFFFHHLPNDGYHKSLWYGQKWRYDVGLVGWWFAANYGSVLTYFALGKILEDLELLAVMISIPNIKSENWEAVTEKNVKFMEKHFVVSKKRKLQDMKECNRFCDSFMVGSDQLWVQSYVSLVGHTFFLDFVDPKKKKIAYATSFGHEQYSADGKDKDLAIAYLQGFDAISVRETSGVDICSNNFGVDAIRLLDPVFLCDVKHYDMLAEESRFKDLGDYLLCYILDPDKETEAAIKYLEKKLQLKALTVFDMKTEIKSVKNSNLENVLTDLSICDFIYLVKNCRYLFTDSHHGVCFGLIYQKNFMCIGNRTRGYTRFVSLFNLLDITERLIEKPSDVMRISEITKDIDYRRVNQVLQDEKERSLNWLKLQLEAPKNKNRQLISSTMLKYMK